MSENIDRCCGDKLQAVACDVAGCAYHGRDNHCHAPHITVENKSAIRKAETFCGTFEPRAGM